LQGIGLSIQIPFRVFPFIPSVPYVSLLLGFVARYFRDTRLATKCKTKRPESLIDKEFNDSGLFVLVEENAALLLRGLLAVGNGAVFSPFPFRGRYTGCRLSIQYRLRRALEEIIEELLSSASYSPSDSAAFASRCWFAVVS
jgi:hypothetical protein